MGQKTSLASDRYWAIQFRSGPNKLERICYATLRDKEPFGESERFNRKINGESFVMPA